MSSQPWVVAAGLSGLPTALWRRYMGLWVAWSLIVAEATAQAEKLQAELEK